MSRAAPGAMVGATSLSESPATDFTPGERAYIRRELDLFFSTLPRVADGFYLRTWRGGPQAGQPQGLRPRPPGARHRGAFG